MEKLQVERAMSDQSEQDHAGANWLDTAITELDITMEGSVEGAVESPSPGGSRPSSPGTVDMGLLMAMLARL